MEKSFIVDSHKMEYIWNSFHNSTLLQMCRQMINTHLLNNGITFCKNGCRGKAISIDAEMEEMLEMVRNNPGEFKADFQAALDEYMDDYQDMGGNDDTTGSSEEFGFKYDDY